MLRTAGAGDVNLVTTDENLSVRQNDQRAAEAAQRRGEVGPVPLVEPAAVAFHQHLVVGKQNCPVVAGIIAVLEVGSRSPRARILRRCAGR